MALTKISTAGLEDQSVTLDKLPHGTGSTDGKFLRANNGADPTFETVSTTPADGSITQAKLNFPVANRNLIINGAMQVAQRNTSSTSSGYQTVDRFEVNQYGVTQAAIQSQSDVASGTTPYTEGFRKAYKIQNGNQGSVANDAFIRFKTTLEAQDIAKSGWNYVSSSSFITLSFWIKSSVGQNFYGRLQTEDGTARNFPFETGSLTANTWTKVTKTIPGNTSPTLQFDNNNSAGLILEIAGWYGSDYTGSMSLNTWATYSNRTPDFGAAMDDWYLTNDATLEITGVQLEVGSVATDFEHKSYAQDLALCQRYFQTQHAFTANDPYYHGYYGGGGGVRWYQLPVTMRTYPNITFNSFSQVQAYEGSSWGNVGGPTAGTSDMNRVLLFIATSSHNYGKLLQLTGGSVYPIFYASAEL